MDQYLSNNHKVSHVGPTSESSILASKLGSTVTRVILQQPPNLLEMLRAQIKMHSGLAESYREECALTDGFKTAIHVVVAR